MDAQELIHRWTQRRREIIKTLPPELLAEYRRLGRLIRELVQEQADELERKQRHRIEGSERESREQAQKALESQNAQELSKRGLKPRRVSLSRRKEVLIGFLATHGPATRLEITEATSIPLGSLSQLLKGEEFEQAVRGLWRLRKSKKGK